MNKAGPFRSNVGYSGCNETSTEPHVKGAGTMNFIIKALRLAQLLCAGELSPVWVGYPLRKTNRSATWSVLEDLPKATLKESASE